MSGLPVSHEGGQIPTEATLAAMARRDNLSRPHCGEEKTLERLNFSRLMESKRSAGSRKTWARLASPFNSSDMPGQTWRAFTAGWWMI